MLGNLFWYFLVIGCLDQQISTWLHIRIARGILKTTNATSVKMIYGKSLTCWLGYQLSTNNGERNYSFSHKIFFFKYHLHKPPFLPLSKILLFHRVLGLQKKKSIKTKTFLGYFDFSFAVHSTEPVKCFAGYLLESQRKKENIISIHTWLKMF